MALNRLTLGKRQDTNATRLHQVAEANMEHDADEIVAAFDAPASIALLMKAVRRAKNGCLLDGPSKGNACTVHVMVSDALQTHLAASSIELDRRAWATRLPKLLRREFGDNFHVIAWTLSTRRFYNPQPGDIILDTRSDVKYAVVPSRRKKTGRRVRSKKA